MINLIDRMRAAARRWGRASAVLGIALNAGACDSLLEVELPAQLGDEALEDPAGAESQIVSIIAHFEQGYDLTTWEFFGREDSGEIQLASPGTNAGDMAYNVSPTTDWFASFMTSRRFAQLLHEKLEGEWTEQQVAERDQFMAISSLYEGAALNVLGSSLCEMALDAGPMMTPAATLDEADAVLTRAIAEISAAGDFEVPYGVSTSALAMAHGLRAQARWMNGDFTGAMQDAVMVPQGFTAYVTRDGSPTRRNKPYWAGTQQRYQELYEVNTWWNPGDRTNPVTGVPWPQALPFTGYPYLGVLPDGRAVWDDTHLPIRVPGGRAEFRRPEEDAAVPDPRVPYFLGVINGVGFERPVHQKYEALGSHIPLVNWKEMVLIRAEVEGGQGAIDLVNELRAFDNLPLVTYADPNDAEQIRVMIIEERRRALFLEGRYFMTKLKNTDVTWFPRGRGNHPGAGRGLGGGVRFTMPDNEYELNDNIGGLTERGTGCDPDEAPVVAI